MFHYFLLVNSLLKICSCFLLVAYFYDYFWQYTDHDICHTLVNPKHVTKVNEMHII
jgi:hypothetical protein